MGQNLLLLKKSMRVPIRKADKYLRAKSDGHMTEAKFLELSAELEKLTKRVRPRLSEEVKKYASDGDFSENAAYQIAKGRLRGINSRIDELGELLKKAEIIRPQKGASTIELGSTVTVEIGGKEKQFQILGGTESNPSSGVISKDSPLGSELLGRRIGEKLNIKLKDRSVEYKIIKIE
jgi:transcription elongation factor GreA